MKFLLTMSATLLTIGVVGCGSSEPSDPLEAAMQAGKEAAAQEDKKQSATHPGDSNPLRRKLSDLEIRHLLFGPEQMDGNWMAWLPCSQVHAGMTVHPAAKVYLKDCDELERDLIAKARDAGFSTITTDHVLDPRLTRAQKP